MTLRTCLVAGALLAAAAAPAAPTDIANVPLASSAGLGVKPNFLFVLDNSSSMSKEYMPEALDDRERKVGYRSSQCNGLAYNPDPGQQSYDPPPGLDGLPLPNSVFRAARDDGHDARSGTTDLQGSVYYAYRGSQRLRGWTYNGDSVDKSSVFYAECMSGPGEAPGSAVFEERVVNANSPEAQRYANWYTYYRTRYAAMRSALAIAVQPLDASVRVGLSSLDDPDIGKPGTFLDVKDFDAGQRSAFFGALYAMGQKSGTPLRRSLATAGQYYAHATRWQAADPVQYSCQRNYALLSTDGYWNGDAGVTLGGSEIGDADAALPPPMRDASATPDTLADVAQYYYATDLRSEALGNCRGALGVDVCANTVPPSGDDTAGWQHMATYTLGLGVGGRLAYEPDYKKQKSGSYADLLAGRVGWPAPSDEGPTRIDDLWHAAVNGRGAYTEAQSPADVTRAIRDAFTEASVAEGTGAAAALSTTRPTGAELAFVSSYRIGDWAGDLRAYPLGSDGSVDPAAPPVWSAAARLDAADAAQRRVLFRKPGGNELLAFTHANLAAYGLAAQFDSICTKVSCAGLSPAGRAEADSGANLVAYLRGERAREGSAYRKRKTRLGDIVASEPAYAGNSRFRYSDEGYAAYRAIARAPIVLVAANDGMLHAFSADPAPGGTGGSELWAFVPQPAMAQMFRLADRDYRYDHRYLFDGSPVVADVRLAAGWRTIAVVGLGLGGSGYYALDITDPSAPTLLWEFQDPNLGLSIGRPRVFKRADGSWVVALSSGYNNRDGRGHLFVLDAGSGRKLLDLATTAGNPANPSGLGQIDAYTVSARDNTALRLYGGDLLGNLWRFDIDDRIAPAGNEATLLATFQVGNVPQPITTRPLPLLLRVRGTTIAAVAVGTGRYLGVSDIADKSQQSIYLVRDTLAAAGLGSVRSALAAATLSVAGGRASLTPPTTLDWTTALGWRIDLPGPGERVVVDPEVLGGSLHAPTVNAGGDPCAGANSSWLYSIDLARASAPDGVDAGRRSRTQIVGLNTLTGSDGKPTVVRTEIGHEVVPQKQPAHSLPSNPRRSAWRELID